MGIADIVRHAASLALLATTACSVSIDKPRDTATAPEWHRFSNSVVYDRRWTYDDDRAVRSIVRCWPIKSGFDCLIGWSPEFSGAYHYELAYQRVKALSEFDLKSGPMLIDPNGYRCSQGGPLLDTMHQVYRDGELILSQPIGLTNQTWGLSNIPQLLKSNGAIGSLGFDCGPVANAIADGSLGSITSTAVTSEIFQTPRS